MRLNSSVLISQMSHLNYLHAQSKLRKADEAVRCLYPTHMNTIDTSEVELTCNRSASTETDLSTQCGEPHWKLGITTFKGNKTSVHPMTKKDGQDFVEADLLFPKLAPSSSRTSRVTGQFFQLGRQALQANRLVYLIPNIYSNESYQQ